MGITKRATKGSPISAAEYDSSWQLFNGAPTGLTIATGAVTITQDNGSGAGKYSISAEGGPGADNLDTINGTANGDMVLLFAPSGHTITVKHATGNLRLEGGVDFVLNSIYDFVFLWNVGGTNLAGKGVNVPA